MKAIPVNTVLLKGNEKKYLDECIRTGWISSEGSFVERFEKELSAYTGRAHGIAVSSGSAALDIAVKAIGIKTNDEVIMPAFTIISPALSVVRQGAIPVLVDSDPITWNMDTEQIEAKITLKTKAIIVVHIYGLPVKMDKILQLAKKYKLKIIEDAAEMHGQTWAGQPCGSFGDISIFSFYANKSITCGEGGMLLTNDAMLEKECRKLRNLAFEPDQPRFVHYEIGWNYRMTNIQAALGVAQLEQLPRFITKKREMGAFYGEHLEFLCDHGYQLPLKKDLYAENIYWVFAIVAPTEKEKERFVVSLNNKQIGTRPFFWCLHEQPLFKNRQLFKGETYPIAEKLARRGLYIPSGMGLTKSEMKRVVSVIKKLY